MNKRNLSLCTLLVLFLALVNSVDRSKFKKCDQSSFCNRNRRLSATPEGGGKYLVKPETISKSSSKLTAKVISPQNKELSLEITTLENDVVRLRIFEENARRYSGPQELILPLKEIPFQETKKTQSSYEFSLGHVQATLGLAPFSLDFLVDGEQVISTNRRSLFNFEHLRSKGEDSIPEKIPDQSAEKPTNWDDETDGIWEAPMIDNPAANGRWDEMFGSHKDSKPYGPTSIGLDFSFVGAKHVYGIPEHATDFALKPTKGEGINSDPYRLYNLDVFEYELNNEMALYGAVPFMISHSPKHTAGILWFNSAETWIDVSQSSGGWLGKDSVDTHWFSESGIVDVFFMLGPSPKDLFKQYASLTGVSQLPPLFAIAYHQCKWNYKSQDEVYEVDGNFDSFNIPYDVIWLDIEHTDGKKYFTWDPNHFATPLEMQEKIKNKGRKMVTIVDPHIKRDTGYNIHSIASSEGIYVKNHEGNEYEGHCWPGSSSWIDYSNPYARSWWADRFSYDNYKGSTDILFTWNDMNEPSVFSGPEVTMHKDARHFQDWEHRDIHNAYGMMMHVATADGLVKRNPGQNERPFVLVRSFFAGVQRYGAVWTGDNAGNWDHLTIAQPMLLSLGVAGVTFAGADVGGFFGNPEPELLTRWYQAGAFHPFFRAHGHLDSKRREPFLLPEPHVSIIRQTIRARYSYLPFWYTIFYQNTLTGLPVMRPLWIEYPQDESAFGEQNEFLVGSDLLVKPVTQGNQRTAEVYFPGSEPWYDVLEGTKYSSPSSVVVDAPLEKIPIFQRGGSIIPKKERPRRSSSQMLEDPYTLVVALDSKAQADGELYVDDYHSFDYTRGKFLRRKFTFSQNKLTSSSIGSETFAVENTVERVVVYGLATPKRVEINSKSGTQELQFTVEKNRVIVRKPDVNIADDWVITFTA